MSPVPRNLTLRLEFQTSSGRTYELDNPMDLSGGWGEGEGGVGREVKGVGVHGSLCVHHEKDSVNLLG